MNGDIVLGVIIGMAIVILPLGLIFIGINLREDHDNTLFLETGGK